MTRAKMMGQAKIQETVDAVDSAIQTVKTTAKKVSKAEQKLQKQTNLNRLPPSVRWESDFMGEIWIGKEYREFWVTEPYQNPVVNLVTSNGTVILSAWESTKENPFMKTAVREFYELIASRGETSLIENRLMTIALQLSGSKKRVDWYAQSAEGLVFKDGERMYPKLANISTEILHCASDSNLLNGKVYYKAQAFARSFPHLYEYVEGFGLAENRLIHHAWLRDRRDGKVIDPTVRGIDQFFGIVFNIKWVDKVIACRLKDDLISPRLSQSIIEGNFLDDFGLLKSGVTPTW